MSAALSIRVGETADVLLPYSEVCMHMRVAGKILPVTLIERNGYFAAQILDESGNRFGAPVTLGEAGIFQSGNSHTGPHNPTTVGCATDVIGWHFYFYGEV